MNPYNILGIEITASPKKVKEAYFSKLRTWHPDKCRDGEMDMSNYITCQLNDAYKTILQKRAHADELRMHDILTRDIVREGSLYYYQCRCGELIFLEFVDKANDFAIVSEYRSKFTYAIYDCPGCSNIYRF
eukprot:GHVP01053104.1.p1 GENE.GHVP01053104.1~~GHVP01053104.1.p1  ORF type:complete len:131 (-),score=7.56 GHVP01053104.1:118-510(-)